MSTGGGNLERGVSVNIVRALELAAERGMAVSWARYVGDEPARITADLRYAIDSGDVVFSCGGIGATPDDHTRQCAAAALGVELELHPEAKALIETHAEIGRSERRIAETLGKAGTLATLPPCLGRVTAAIEAAAVPVVVALHGSVMGPGAEIALAAHARVDSGRKRGSVVVTLG